MNVITAMLKDKNVQICHGTTTQMSSRFMMSRRALSERPSSLAGKYAEKLIQGHYKFVGNFKLTHKLPIGQVYISS